MVCIYCGSETQVINSRLQKRPNQVWRRRKCLECGATFTTHEIAAYEGSWRVKTSSGQLVPFNKNKLFLSLYKSLAHREHALEDATALTDTVIGKLLRASQNGALEVNQIIIATHEVLNRFDKPAAISYQAFHPMKD